MHWYDITANSPLPQPLLHLRVCIALAATKYNIPILNRQLIKIQSNPGEGSANKTAKVLLYKTKYTQAVDKSRLSNPLLETFHLLKTDGCYQITFGELVCQNLRAGSPRCAAVSTSFDVKKKRLPCPLDVRAVANQFINTPFDFELQLQGLCVSNT